MFAQAARFALTSSFEMRRAVAASGNVLSARTIFAAIPQASTASLDRLTAVLRQIQPPPITISPA